MSFIASCADTFLINTHEGLFLIKGSERRPELNNLEVESVDEYYRLMEARDDCD